LPACPFCHSVTPNWIPSTGADGRAYFRCEKCGATLSSAAARTAEDITYMRVDSIGSSSANTSVLGTECPTTQLQKMAGCVTPASTTTSTGYHTPLSTPAAPMHTPSAAPSYPTTPAYMTPPPSTPSYTPPTMPPYTPPRRRSEQPWKVFSIVGFVLGFIDIVFAFIPFYNIVSMYLSIAGIVFSALGKRSYSNHGKAVAGLVLNILALVFSFIMMFAYADILSGSGYYYF